MNDFEIRERLASLSDFEYKKFNDKIVPTSYETLGVRMPALKSFAKELARGDAEEYFSHAVLRNYEEIMLYGLTLGYAKLPLETYFRYFDPLVKKFDNWAHVDCIVGAAKIFSKHKDEVLNHFMPLMTADGEYEKRTFVIILMDYFTDDEHIDKTLELLAAVPRGQYYTDMAIAWALSVCFVKHWDKTLAVFDRNVWGEFVYKKTISKCVDSFRISPERKEFLKEARRS